MEIIYSKKDVEDLIKKYYLEKEGRTINVSITPKKERVGFYEEIGCIAEIKISEVVKVFGNEVTATGVITKSDLESIFKELLEETDYKLVVLEYQDGINSNWEGYGMGETKVDMAYFNGIKLYVNPKQSLTKRKERC